MHISHMVRPSGLLVLTASIALGLLTAGCATPPAQPEKIIEVEVIETVGEVDTASLEADAAEIEALMNAQDEAWNEGDIEGFMQGYWKSPDLRFASGDTVVYGWDETLARYKKRYSNRALMGLLDTQIIALEIYSPDDASVFGKWKLTRAEEGDIGGLFTLQFRRIDGHWRIISDHTS
ncbi:MAG: DUF4440 domain-containing protein [Hirschia sp.]|nr:DUF4440 domain-containing protein [Hirschia sp.]MBF18502.1 DUF4440 domain-containing protein [Hirschia sp.]